jgi:MFS family permease
MKLAIDLSPLRHRNYRLLFIGQAVSFIGTMIARVALPYQIYQETHSILMVGFISLAQLLPLLFTALLGGAIADRHHRRQLLILTELALALCCLLLTFNAILSHPHVWLIFMVSSLMSAITGLHRPAIEGITQQVVTKEDFVAVGMLSTFKYSIVSIGAPAIAGFILAQYGLAITYFLDFFSYIISLGALLSMSYIPAPELVINESVWSALKDGLRFAGSRQELLGSYFVDFIAMIFGMPNALFPAIAQTFGGAKALGFLYAAPAVGSLLLVFFTSWFKSIKRHGVAIAVAAALWGVAIIGFGLASHLAWALLFLALAGMFDGMSAVFRSTLWNESIPTHYRGRLAGIEMISYLSGPKLGDTESALVATLFGITFSVVSGGVLCVVGVGICCAFLPKFWRYRSAI